MHTEGSIIFSDPELYDKRNAPRERWRWEIVRDLLDPDQAEPSASVILSIFEPLKSDNGRFVIEMEPLGFAEAYFDDPSTLEEYVTEIVEGHAERRFTRSGLERQVELKVAALNAIESYLMAYWDDSVDSMVEEGAAQLAEGTLAHSLAGEDTQIHIVELFKLIAANIEASVPDPDKRTLFGRTLFGVRSSLVMEAWVNDQIEQILGCDAEGDLLLLLWPMFQTHIQNATFQKCNPPGTLKDIANAWIQGRPFHEIFLILKDADARIGEGEKPRHPTIDHVVDICENGLSYDGMLILGAIIELVERASEEDEATVEKLKNLQKRLKYGLASKSTIIFYELGFADRVISTDISEIAPVASTRGEAIDALRRNEGLAREKIGNYPSYFALILDNVLV